MAGLKIKRFFSYWIEMPDIAEYFRRKEFMIVLVVIIFIHIKLNNYFHSWIIQYFMKCSSIMISMAMTYDDSTNNDCWYAHFFKMVTSKRWWVYHYSSTSNPKYISRGWTFWIEPMWLIYKIKKFKYTSKNCNSKIRRSKG